MSTTWARLADIVVIAVGTFERREEGLEESSRELSDKRRRKPTCFTLRDCFDLDHRGERRRFLGAQCDDDREVRPRSGAHLKGDRSPTPQRDGLDALHPKGVHSHDLPAACVTTFQIRS